MRPAYLHTALWLKYKCQEMSPIISCLVWPRLLLLLLSLPFVKNSKPSLYQEQVISKAWLPLHILSPPLLAFLIFPHPIALASLCSGTAVTTPTSGAHFYLVVEPSKVILQNCSATRFSLLLFGINLYINNLSNLWSWAFAQGCTQTMVHGAAKSPHWCHPPCHRTHKETSNLQ